ncbi:hypothetical protein Bca52824_007852 [Brassica carinata]|uniref:NAC domain-containing protein n=1 Tax=Brassica carinata TaxID=52824 RepID=A0A8X7W6Y8_BRACI|nr:hypothetical protein Bca52824_007852 [Brassica carinata]
MAHPRDLKFSPIDQNLVEYYLRKRVETEKDGFITDIKLYEDEPWLLPHVKNDQFKENRWFYYVVRTRNLGRRPKRTVPGRGSSDGGTWTTSGVKKEITDRKTKVVIGYKTELAYYKKVEGKTKGDTTGWCMTEYWLASENDAQFQEVVLCHLRNNKKIVVDQSPERKNRDNDIVTEQPQQENNNMFDKDELLDYTHQQQPLIPPFEGHDSRFPVQYMTPPSGEGEGLGLQTIMGYSDKATQEQQHPQISRPLQRQDSEIINNPLLITEDECVDQDEIFNLADLEAGITQPQQQHQMMMDPYDDISLSRLAMPNNLVYSQDSWDQDTSPWNNNTTTNPRGLIFNTHGYEIQDQTVTKGVIQDSYY